MIVDDFGNLVPPSTVRSINQRLDEGDARMGRIEGDVGDVRADIAAVRKDLETNTKATQAVATNTAELVEMFQAMKGALKVLNWIGSWAKPLAYVIGLGTAALGFWTAIKGHLK